MNTRNLLSLNAVLAIEGEPPAVWGIFVLNLLLGLSFAYFAMREDV